LRDQIVLCFAQRGLSIFVKQIEVEAVTDRFSDPRPVAHPLAGALEVTIDPIGANIGRLVPDFAEPLKRLFQNFAEVAEASGVRYAGQVAVTDQPGYLGHRHPIAQVPKRFPQILGQMPLVGLRQHADRLARILVVALTKRTARTKRHGVCSLALLCRPNHE